MVATIPMVTDLTNLQYEPIRRKPRIVLPTVEEWIESRIARLTAFDLATETDLRMLASHVKDRNFAFVPAWPNPIDLRRWMALIEYGGRTGETHLTPGNVIDLIALPRGPFVMLDIDDGWSRRNCAPCTSLDRITADGRLPFTVRMGVSYLGDHPYAIERHSMDLVGSRFGTKDVPVLRLHDDAPLLTGRWNDHAYPKWGAPSCGSVIGLGH